MMTKLIFSFLFISITTCALADSDDKKKDTEKVTPKTELSDDRSFNVLGLNACVGEFEDEDGIGVFTEIPSYVLELIPLTEDLDESSVLDFN
jgi:hypothetical protein